MVSNEIFKQKLEQIGGGEIKPGISLRGNNTEKILEFINANTKHNYIVSNGFLTKNDNLEDVGTSLDIEILQAISENRKIVIALSSEISDFVKTYISEENVYERIILLNEQSFTKSSLANEALSDYLTKALFKYNSGIALLSSKAIQAVIGSAATVYHGPDASVYASAGSISAGESNVYILGRSMDWYHIEYQVTSTGKNKTGYIPASAITSYSGGTPAEEDFYGGYCFATSQLAVNTCDIFANTAPTGTLFANEGCTFLFSYTVNGTNVAFIEYSTSSGTKRGYVAAQNLKFTCETIVAIAKERLDVYGGPSTSHSPFGTIFKNELMSVIAKQDNMIYVEYNTTKGRKRGYVEWSKVNPRDYNSSIVFNNFYPIPSNSSCHIVDERVIVYAGPSTSYAEIGAVRNEDVVCYWTNNTNYALTCIEYIVASNGLKKRGYIDPSKVITGSLPLENNELESFDESYPYFGSKIPMSMTQLNQRLFYYKAGTGAKHIFLVFAQHGWEDGKQSDGTYQHGDGNMLSKIAKNFINRFSSMNVNDRNSILQNWTIYLFPRINPDGIVYGNTNNGFGRCFHNKIDPNRSWPGNFQVYTDSRNYTGNSYLGAPELQSLESVLRANISDSENILLDIHGWENSVISNDNTISNYFLTELKKLNSNCKNKKLGRASGYLTTWAENARDLAISTTDKPGLGAKSVLVEFPPTTDYSTSTVESYGEKFFTATTNLLLSKVVDVPETPKNFDAYRKLKEIYDLAAYFNDSDNVLKNNLLVLDFLRYEDYSIGKDIFGIAFDTIANSSAKTNFYNHIKKYCSEELLPSNVKVYVKDMANYMDLQHFALTAMAAINNTYDTYKDLAGWAGDLLSLAAQVQSKYNSNNTKYNYTAAELATLIGGTDDQAKALGFSSASATTFDKIDYYQDLDAVNLAYNLKLEPIYDVIFNYYENDGDSNRETDFIRNIINYNGLSNDAFRGELTFNQIIKQYTKKQLDNAIWGAIFSTAFGSFDSSIWGDKLATAFENRVLGITEPTIPTIPNLSYKAHVQYTGWMPEVFNGAVAGTEGQGLRIEAIEIFADIDIQYRVHMAGLGWGEWVPKGCMAGTTGQDRAIEAIEIITSYNPIQAQAHVQNVGWMAPVTGKHIIIGTEGQGLQLEAFTMKFLEA